MTSSITRPASTTAGNLLKPGRVTVLQNGVLIQDNVEIKGPTSGPVTQSTSRTR